MQEAAATQRWHILGAGAIGRLFACKLARIGLTPVLLSRGHAAGTELQRLRAGEREEEWELPLTRADALRPSEITGLLVTTKANDAVAAVAGIQSAIAASAPVILLHNGMGVRERLAEVLPQLSVYSGTTTEGAYIEADGVLVHAGKGNTVIGAQDQTAPVWFEPLAASEERFSWSADIDHELWKKLLINCAINPLTALHRCRNGALLDDPALRTQLEQLCEELAAVSTARGNPRAATCTLDWVLGVVQRTAANQSSMLQDVLRGRPTEIEYITGYLLQEADRLGVPCPRHRELLEQLDERSPSN